MARKKSLTRAGGAGLALAAVVLAAAPISRADDAALRLYGLALNLTGVGGGRSGEVEIAIERWSGEEERSRLLHVLAVDGTAGLARVLAEASPRAGFIRTQRGGSLDLKYAGQRALPGGGHQIVLVTDRLGPVSGRPQADTYDFLVVDIRLDREGTGEGRTAGPERLHYDRDAQALTVNRSGVEPVWIQGLSLVPRR
jgi:hypothetical protein